MTTILGIDEAGRGPVVGPLVMCGFLIDEKDNDKLISLGVKDSKVLSPSTRMKIYKELKIIAKDYVVLKISAKDIDNMRESINLNRIEINRMKQIISLLNPDKVFVDSMEVRCDVFEKKLRSTGDEREYVCENHADSRYPVVSAASIIAKVERDKEIEKLKEKYGFQGTGYPSDDRTIKFLVDWISENKDFPDFVRKSWITAQIIKEKKEQKSWKDFLHQ